MSSNVTNRSSESDPKCLNKDVDTVTEKSIPRRIQEAFRDEESRAYAGDYLTALRENIRDMNLGFRRNFLLLMLLFAVFVLLAQGAAKEISMGGLTLNDYSLVYVLLPVAVMYVYNEMMSISIMR